MFAQFTIDGSTNQHQLRAMSRFLADLGGLIPEAAAVPPADPADLTEPETTVVTSEQTTGTQPRKRRTKAEIAAEAEAQRLAEENARVAAAEAEAQKGNEAEADPAATAPSVFKFWTNPAGEFGAEGDGQAQPADATEIDEAGYNKLMQAALNSQQTSAGADEFEQVAADPAAGGKDYTEAQVQALATAVARTKGPQVVKDKIAELGAPRIAALSPEQLNVLGAFLEAQK